MELEAKAKIDLGTLSEALERGMLQRAAGLIEDLPPAWTVIHAVHKCWYWSCR